MLKVTDRHGKTVFVNPANVCAVYENQNGTLIMLSGGQEIQTKETPEAIAQQMPVTGIGVI